MKTSARVYDFTIPANQSREILCVGSYYKIISSLGSVDIRRDGGSVIGPLLAGQGESGNDFMRLILTDRSGTANSGKLLVSDGSFIDTRMYGSIGALDGYDDIAATNLASNFCSFDVTGDATHIATVSLTVASTSVKQYLVKSIYVYEGTTVGVNELHVANAIIGSTPTPVYTKKLNISDVNGNGDFQVLTSNVTYANAAAIGGGAVIGKIPRNLVNTWNAGPWVATANQSLTICASAVATNIKGFIEFYSR